MTKSLMAGAIVILTAVVVVLVLALSSVHPIECHFKNGGTIQAGQFARTDDGRQWLCTANAELIHVPG